MKYLRPDNNIVFFGHTPIDMNDRDYEDTAIELTLPDGFSEKAKEAWSYFEGAAFIFEYKGKLVVTDEGLYLTEHGTGEPGSPYGCPRATFRIWYQMEAWLEQVHDELEEDGFFG